jgi:cytochrome c oxidase subunit 1
MIAGIGLMMVNLLGSLARERTAAADDPWGGVTLEWTIPSPPPLHNFDKDPEVMDYPYDFTKVAAAGSGAGPMDPETDK